MRWRRRKKKNAEEPADEALGRSRWGISTKIHILCDGHGNPLHFYLTGGHTNESTVFDILLEQADAAIHDTNGQPIAWPVSLSADKAYRAKWIDDYLIALGIQPVIPSKSTDDRTKRPEFDSAKYRNRNIVERLIGWLKESRRVFSRFEKTVKNYGGIITLAFIHRYLRLATL